MEAIDLIANTSSKNEKQALVAKAMGDLPNFKRVCEYAYNPFKTYGIAKRPEAIVLPLGHVAYAINMEFNEQTWDVLDDLISRRLTGEIAIDTVGIELGRLSVQSADLFWRIIKKDLRAGFSESTINKASKGLIQEFPYMRCSLPKDTNLEEWPWSRGVISQEKADGMFANLDHEEAGLDGSRVSIRSRQGTEFPMEQFANVVKEIQKRMLPGFQRHGEFVVERDGVILARAEGNGVMNHVLSGGSFAENEQPIYLVWDEIPLSSVVSKGKCSTGYVKRLASIVKQLNAVAGESVMLIPTKVVKTLPDAYAHAADLMKLGKEGTVIKHPDAIWKDSTSKDQIKIKLEFEVDLEIIAIVEGKADGKNEGRAGSLTCKTVDGLLLVDVTVKNEDMRNRVDANHDNWIGKIIAVVANDITLPSNSNELHSLFLPRMAEPNYRTDKHCADSLLSVFAQKEAAIFGKSLLKEAA